MAVDINIKVQSKDDYQSHPKFCRKPETSTDSISFIRVMFFLRFTRFNPFPVNHLGKVINCTNHSKGKHDDQKCHNVLIQVTPENRCNQYSQ